jgi:NDP-sugar pyrophosphorylase family protein
VNIGLYFLKSSALDLISGDEFLHMTDIIHILKEKGFKFGVYPVTEKSWLDVGQQEFLLRQLQAHNF